MNSPDLLNALLTQRLLRKISGHQQQPQTQAEGQRLPGSFSNDCVKHLQVNQGCEMMGKRNKGFVKVVINVEMFGALAELKPVISIHQMSLGGSSQDLPVLGKLRSNRGTESSPGCEMSA